VPVYNEARVLETSISRLRSYLDSSFPFTSVVTIVDNGSTDDTYASAQRLAGRLSGVRAVHLERKGRGGALRAAWMRSEAEVVAYMDVDLSTSLSALLPLVAPILSGHAEVAIGTRLGHGARVSRSHRRSSISHAYNLLLHLLVRSSFTDAQCGFKALRADAAHRLLPAVEDDEWFFDTELLLLAQREGIRIHEVPVDWVEDPDSRVDLLRTALKDLRGVLRLMAHSMRPSTWGAGRSLREQGGVTR